MPARDIESIRNVCVVGDDGQGKSSLVEAALFDAKALKELKRPSEGSCALDKDPEEAKRGATLATQVYTFDWNKRRFHLLDTPGSSNFEFDAKAAIAAVDSAVLVVDATDTLKATEVRFKNHLAGAGRAWAMFVNKMDAEGADFERVLEGMRNLLEQDPVPFLLPIGEGENFKGVVNLVDMKAYLDPGDASGKTKAAEIPEEVREAVDRYREKLVEAAVEMDEALMEKYLEEGTISEEELGRCLRQLLAGGSFVPVLCGSAEKNVGVRQLLDFLADYALDPLARGPWKGTKKAGDDGEEVERKPDASEPFSAFVFKTTVDRFAGKTSYIRVVSGLAKSDMAVTDSTLGRKDKYVGIAAPAGRENKPVDEAGPGEIVAVGKLKEVRTGHTICEDSKPVVYNICATPRKIVTFAVVASGKGDEKVSQGISKLMEEDPTLDLYREAETGELLISGMGLVHLEVTQERLKRKFDAEMTYELPKVKYRETIKKKSGETEGKLKKQTGGRGQFGVCYIELSPRKRGEGYEFANEIKGGAIPTNFIPAVEKGFLEAMAAGPVAGYPVVDVRVRLFDGKHHPVDSSEIAFKLAGSFALKAAMMKSNPVLLEPVYKAEITVPEEYLGAITGDLNSRRGKVTGMEPGHGVQVIGAEAPHAEMLRYASDLRSMTQDTGTFWMEFVRYEEVPAQLAEKIIAQRNVDKEAEK